MRKFTKEISALLASVAVGSAAFAGAVSASSEASDEMQYEKIGTEVATTTRACCETTIAVGTMTGEEFTTPDTEEYIMTQPIGTMMAEETTLDKPEDPTDYIAEETDFTYPIGTEVRETTMASQTTTTTAMETTTIPPLAGIPLPPDETIEPTIPPLSGDVAPADGDIDGDGEFGLTDIIVFQKWLHRVPGTKTTRFWAADLNHDGEVDIFDFSLMKRSLLRYTVTSPVEPAYKSTYRQPAVVRADSLKMYLGPDTSYRLITDIPNGTTISEIGYQDPVGVWMYTEYNGKFGWVRTMDEVNNKATVYFDAMVDKPVIYLYPEQKTDVRVTLELTESELATTYPKYQDGWNVTAYPDGTLLNKADGTHHRYLFWDSSNCRTRFDFSKGFCIAGKDTEKFLKEKLAYLGMTEGEINEFIVYWLPLMEHHPYNLISFQGDTYANSAKLNITPAPDSVCRIFMAYVPLNQVVEIEPQQLETFERKGFTVVEWGGTEIHS